MAAGRGLSLVKGRYRWWLVAAAAAGLLILAVAAYSAAVHVSAVSGPRLYLSPSGAHVPAGDAVTVTVREDSGSAAVNAVQANLSYDRTKLQFESVTASGSAFGIEAQGDGGGGHVTIARAVRGGAAPVTGDQLVATVTFQALAGSGTAAVSFSSGSAVVRSHGNSELPVQFVGATYQLAPGAGPAVTPYQTPTPSPAASGPDAGSASMYLSPASGSVAPGGELTFDIHENSGATAVNAVQADFSYPTGQFNFVTISTATSAFGLQAQSSGDHGHIVIVRAITPGSAPLTGDHVVATVVLKALGSGSAAVTPAGGSAVLSSTNSTNILNTTTGGNYSIGN